MQQSRRYQQQQPQQRPYLQANGHLVYEGGGQAKSSSTFSWLRFALLSVVLALFIVTNPANQRQPLIRSLFPLKNVNNSYDLRRTTNYGLFCVKERTIQAVVGVGGTEWACPYDHPQWGVSFVCKKVLRDNCTHQKPLLPFTTSSGAASGADRVFTTHRIIEWTVIILALMRVCFTSPPPRPILFHTTTKKNNVWVGSFLSIFFDNDTDETLLLFGNMLHKLFDLNVFVYPVLKIMDEVVPQQQASASVFAVFANDDFNYALSVTTLVLLAVLVNTASLWWWSGRTGTFLLRFNAVTAVSLGYYTYYQQLAAVTSTYFTFQPSNNNVEWNISPEAVVWTLLLSTLLFTGSFKTALFWYLAYAAGQCLANYQYEHLTYIAAARTFYNWMESTARTIEQGFRNLFSA